MTIHCDKSHMKTLYKALKDAGIETAAHESDLYFPVTPETRAILKRFPIQQWNATVFTNEAHPNIGERWFDVPFAYDPYWQARESHAKS